jgi:3'(2'), 5'-bisphosphate nucleotidase
MPNALLPDPVLDALLRSALAGADAVMGVYATDFVVDEKPDQSPVCDADRLAEAAILTSLGDAFPGVPIIAEESAAAGIVPAIGGRFLLVDPLDGTKEFVRRNGEFTVNVALIEDGAPVAGIVLAPALGLAYAGGASGAFKGNWFGGSVDGFVPIGVRPSPPQPVAVASRSHLTPETEAFLAGARAGERRSIGSSLKFCLVAEGAADLYPRHGPTMEWDTAAGDAVLRAAGGSVRTLDGAPLSYGKASAPGMRPFENPFFIAAGDPALAKTAVL